jgi:signal transduction histidine kinase
MITIFIITIFLVAVATGIIFLVLIYQKKQLQYIAEKKQLQVTYEKEILESKLEIQEQTFKNISQEIHDNIGQVLTLVKLNINTMATAEPPALQNKISDSRNLITKAIQDLRDLSKSMNTDLVIEAGLTQAIEYESELIKKTGGYEIEYNITGNVYRLQNQQELILFRLVQEALNNIIKHAKATRIKIAIAFEPNIFTLHVTDNGVGFSAGELKLNPVRGSGLRNMENRAKMINGNFTCTSVPGKGTSIFIALPIETKK